MREGEAERGCPPLQTLVLMALVLKASLRLRCTREAAAEAGPEAPKLGEPSGVVAVATRPPEAAIEEEAEAGGLSSAALGFTEDGDAAGATAGSGAEASRGGVGVAPSSALRASDRAAHERGV